MRNFDYSRAKEINIEVDGKNVIGQYIVQSKMVTVTSLYGQKSTQVGSLNPENLARLLLRELYDSNKNIFA